MSVCSTTPPESTQNVAVQLRGHQPQLFSGQKGRILALLLARRGTWVPAPELAKIALQYCARIKELRDAGYKIENQKERVGRQVHGSFRLVACPGDPAQRSIPYSNPSAPEGRGV